MRHGGVVFYIAFLLFFDYTKQASSQEAIRLIWADLPSHGAKNMMKRFLGPLLVAVCLVACGGEMTSGSPSLEKPSTFLINRLFIEPAERQDLWGRRLIIDSTTPPPHIQRTQSMGPKFDVVKVQTPGKYICEPGPCQALSVSSPTVLPFGSRFEFDVIAARETARLVISTPKSFVDGLYSLLASPDWTKSVACTSDSGAFNTEHATVFVSPQTRPGVSEILIEVSAVGSSSSGFQFKVNQAGVGRYRLSGIGTGPAADEVITCSVPAPTP